MLAAAVVAVGTLWLLGGCGDEPSGESPESSEPRGHEARA
jgi:hypothetical protein